VLRNAYVKLADTPPWLPSTGSAVPALLATRNISQTTTVTREAANAAEIRLKKATERLRREETNLEDAKALSVALESRVVALRAQEAEQQHKNPRQVAQDLLKQKQHSKKDFDRDYQRLWRAFEEFVDSHLAAHLAAEELGGPVVGNLADVDEETLMKGFSSQGKVRKRTSTSADSRQRRIDDIWGHTRHDGDDALDEQEAAGTEMKDLFEELLKARVGTDSGDGFIELARESAAARLLVRAKVAQFGQRGREVDATKLRLIDFGRQLD
jgi:hypothetical protein